MRKKFAIIVTLAVLMFACTTGQLYYTDDTGKRVLACDVEFVGLPSVDKYAVEYALSLCANQAAAKGFDIDESQTYLLNLDLSIPDAPCGSAWNHDIAQASYDSGLLSAKQYGYIVAHIDLGLAKLNHC